MSVNISKQLNGLDFVFWQEPFCCSLFVWNICKITLSVFNNLLLMARICESKYTVHLQVNGGLVLKKINWQIKTVWNEN